MTPCLAAPNNDNAFRLELIQNKEAVVLFWKDLRLRPQLLDDTRGLADLATALAKSIDQRACVEEVDCLDAPRPIVASRGSSRRFNTCENQIKVRRRRGRGLKGHIEDF